MILRSVISAVILTLCLSHGPVLLAAEEPVILAGKDRDPLGLHLGVLEDKTGILTINDAASSNASKLYTVSSREVVDISVADTAYWFRFTVEAARDDDARGDTWYAVMLMSLDRVDFYHPDGKGGFRVMKAGECVPVGIREIPSRRYVFPLKLEPGMRTTFYMRVRSEGPFKFILTLQDRRSFFSGEIRETFVYGMFYGILLITLLYNIFIFATVRSRDYFYYIFYLVCVILWHLSLNGYGSIFLWPELSRWGSRLHVLALSLSNLSGALFIISFLNFRRLAPRLYRASLGYVAFVSLLVVAAFFLPFRVIFPLSMYVIMAAALAVLVIGYLWLFKGYEKAGYFTAAWTVQLAGIIVFGLYTEGLLPRHFITIRAQQIGSLIEVVLITLALRVRFQSLQRAKEAAQAQAIESFHEADRMKDEFLAKTSHELRTPLHGIIGLSESLLAGIAGRFPEKAGHSLFLIGDSGRRLLGLVDDILDFSRIKNGDVRMEPKPVDVHSAAALVLDLLSPVARGKGLILRNGVRPGAPPISADEERFRQILVNLVGNAIKFTPSGRVEVTASPSSGGMMAVRVSDTGIGIMEKDRGRIFDQFEQVDGDLSRPYGGVGLGLSITKNLAELQGGCITVDSEEGRGSTFTVTMPLAERDGSMGAHHAGEPAVPDAIPAGMFTPDREDTPAIPGGATVLVADDDPVSVKILVDYLEDRGCTVFTAGDGMQALDVLERNASIELVLLDVMMPLMSGYEALRKIRETRSGDSLPVIMVTAKTLLADIERGYDLGANDYILKPFHLAELASRIGGLLRKKPPEECLSIAEKGKRHLFPYRDILYLTSSGRKTVVHTVERDFEIAARFMDVERKLPGNFVRVHRRHIVNLEFVTRVAHLESGRYEVLLRDDDDTRLVASRSYIGALKEKM